MQDYSNATNFVKNIGTNIFDFLSFGEEEDVNKAKFTIFDIFDFKDFEQECNANKYIDLNNITKKQEMINKAVVYLNAFEEMLQDFKNRDFGDGGGNKAALYVNAFEEILKDFNNKDFGNDKGNKQIAVDQITKNEKKDHSSTSRKWAS